MTLTTFLFIIIPLFIAFASANFLAVKFFVDKYLKLGEERLNVLEGIARVNSDRISKLEVPSQYVSPSTCAFNEKENERKLREARLEIKNDIKEVEERLIDRIEKIEEKLS